MRINKYSVISIKGVFRVQPDLYEVRFRLTFHGAEKYDFRLLERKM